MLLSPTSPFLSSFHLTRKEENRCRWVVTDADLVPHAEGRPGVTGCLPAAAASAAGERTGAGK